MTKAFFSMNNHQVATPEMMLEEARSYIMFFEEPGGKHSAYIGLHLLQSGRKLFYAHSSNPFQAGEMASVEDEALGFVEGLGALLDAVDFSKLSSDERNRWIEQQDIFAQRPEPEASPEEKPVETAQQEASPVQLEPQASQASSAVSESASQVQLPPPIQPAPPVQDAPQPPQVTSAPPMPDLSQSQQATQAPFGQQVPPMQYTPQPQQAPPAAAPLRYTPPAPQQTPPVQYAPQPPQQPAPPAAYTPQTQPAPPDQPAPETQSPLAHASYEYGGHETPAQTPEHERRPPVQKAPLGAPAKDKQEIMQKAIKAGIVKAPKALSKKEAPSATGVVSRDREALARLLTSF